LIVCHANEQQIPTFPPAMRDKPFYFSLYPSFFTDSFFLSLSTSYKTGHFFAAKHLSSIFFDQKGLFSCHSPLKKAHFFGSEKLKKSQFNDFFDRIQLIFKILNQNSSNKIISQRLFFVFVPCEMLSHICIVNERQESWKAKPTKRLVGKQD